ncbi:MAG: tetratricopeptide repeat protein [Leptolyngbyaceae bacterium]|nr:tetratricopeptide repeat protein [Leptolyngbyaceae bacterium]
MIESVAAAIERKDYKTAARLLKPLLTEKPKDPWVQLYYGQLQEFSGKNEAAEKVYLRLLKGAENPKVALQARRGIDRITALMKEKRQEAIAKAQEDPTNAGTGFLVLEAVIGDQRAIAAKRLAKILNLDVYSAQFQIPSRGWRLYRTGPFAEIQVYGEELQQAGIPVFWKSLADIRAIHVFKVDYIQSMTGQPTVVCRNDADQVGHLSFPWSDVTQMVKGRLPIFEQVVDLDAFKKLKRKEQTQDYTQMLDLHLPGRKSILRFCDRTYQFQKGIPMGETVEGRMSKSQSSIRLQWNQMMAMLDQQVGDRPTYTEFNSFAQTAFDHLDLLEPIPTHIELFRKEHTHWDPAYQLYSGLAFRANA